MFPGGRAPTLYIFWKSLQPEGEGLATVRGGATALAASYFAPLCFVFFFNIFIGV